MMCMFGAGVFLPTDLLVFRKQPEVLVAFLTWRVAVLGIAGGALLLFSNWNRCIPVI